MPSAKQLAEARRTATRIHRVLGEDAMRFREDAGLTGRQLADAAGVDHAHLQRIEGGDVRASLDTYARVARALGLDLNARMYANTGPAIRDRHQARILEALLGQLHGRWRVYPEVAVRRPSRGWIDVVLHEAREEVVVATEIQCDLRRLEQLLRWFPEKVAALPSWTGWSRLGTGSTPSQLLIVRSTRATRQIGRDVERQLAAAYPTHPADAIAALTGTSVWPGPALIWAAIERDRVRFIARR